MDWLRSRWDWIVRNKFSTCVIVFAVGLLVFGVVTVCRHWGWIVTESGSTIIRNLGLVIGGLIAIGFGIWRGVVARCQAKTSQRGLLNERYQKGAEMLGSKVLAVRLGGIYALQHLAEDEPEQYHVQIMRLLCSFVLNPHKDEDLELRHVTQALRSQTREDVQDAMRPISNRSDGDIELEKKETFRLDLINVDLDGADLSRANLTDANLAFANLTGADLSNAILTDAHLPFANLTGTDFSGAVGVTQDELDQAKADPNSPPKLDGAHNAETGAPLEWRGQPCGT